MNLEYLYRPHHKAIEHIKSYQVQRPTGKWFYLSDVHAIAEYYNTSTYSIYQLLTRSPKEIKGNYEIYESDNIKIKVQYRLYTTSTNNNVSLMSDYIKSIYLMQSN